MGLEGRSTFSGLQGQATSGAPGRRGIPTLCRHFTKGESPSTCTSMTAGRRSTCSTLEPTLVMILMLTAT